MMLKAANISYMKAVNGVQAVEVFYRDRAKKCCEKRIKLVFMDIVMPSLDGFGATERIMDILRSERQIAGTYDTINDK